jgi:hypothetical protein
MRMIMSTIALAATVVAFGASSAPAQSSASYPYCLFTDDAQDCTYTSMAQCLASKRGNADFCQPNNWYSGAAHHSGTRR